MAGQPVGRPRRAFMSRMASGMSPALPRPMACAMRSRRFSFCTDSAPALKRTTAGRNMALSVPWCRRGFTAAQAVAQRMHGAQPFWKAMAPCHAGAHHVQARLAVAAVARGLLDGGPASREAVERDAVGGRVEGCGHEGFHAVGNRVHAGGGRQHGRQTQCELGVANGGFGHDEPRCENPVCGRRQRSKSRPGPLQLPVPAGGGHGDQRGNARSVMLERAALDGGVVF